MGELPREKAMVAYVDELRKIVETMSYNDNVADFYSSVAQLDNVSLEDLQLVAPAAIENNLSNPNSPLHSRETSPTRIIENIPNGYTNGYQNGYGQSATDTSDDEYIDTVEARVKKHRCESYFNDISYSGRDSRNVNRTRATAAR